MAVDDYNLNIENLQDLSDEEEKEYSSYNELSMSESQLCVPLDPIEDLEWFPNFRDDFISLKNVESMTQHQSHYFANENPNQPREDQRFVDFPMTPEQQEEIKAKQNGEEIEKDGIEAARHEFIGLARKKFRTKNHRKPRRRMTFVKKRCSHCQADETPQWRNGPLGPKTLCNACGVRFKSGRLVPEYRPVASPTFDGTKHSNYHRKILQRLSLH